MAETEEARERSNNTLLLIRRNSLDLNSFLAERWRRSMKSSPLRSTISSFSSSVDLPLISFSSSSLLAIIATDEARLDDTPGRRVGHKCEIRTPLNGDEVDDLVRFNLEGRLKLEIERLVILRCEI
ncbi:molecular chaperone heat shock protein [Striga asiatica]|uniref:Molecular chaperone heat shock protein n=1 Tax=Striga asiatica TaxID=4170 RepID=A0A5A7R030_STRAF|nr:molecular chaperone heat shock protein [Striga asiatica]